MASGIPDYRIKKTQPIKTGKPVRPGDKLNPLPTVGGNSKAIKDKRLKTLQLNIDKANKAKAPKMKAVPMPKSKTPRNTKRGM